VIPDFNEIGDLPVGVYPATLAEVMAHFGVGSGQRQAVARRLERIHALAHATGCVARMILFGSFVTDKVEPNDVDVVIIMDDEFDPDQMTGETKLLFDHAAAQAYYGAAAIRHLRRPQGIRRGLAIQARPTASRHYRLDRGEVMIENDIELQASQERIARFQQQLAHLRKVETNPTAFRLSSAGFIAEIDRMQLEVREYLGSLPVELKKGA
jgi:hypothetical protein